MSIKPIYLVLARGTWHASTAIEFRSRFVSRLPDHRGDHEAGLDGRRHRREGDLRGKAAAPQERLHRGCQQVRYYL